MSCRTDALHVSSGPAPACGVAPGASQAGYETGRDEKTWRYLPRCEGCKRFLSAADPVCRNRACPLRGTPQAELKLWPLPRPRGGHLWRDYRRQMKRALEVWRSERDDLRLGRVRTELALALADAALDGEEGDHPAGRGGALAEERARLLLQPPPSLSVAERVERVAVLDIALAVLRHRRAIDEAEYRAAMVGTLIRWGETLPRSRAPLTWLAERPVGGEEETASQVDPARKMRVRYRVVDLAEPVASNTPGGGINPDYDGGLQPRRRGRAASRAQIEAIARRLDAGTLLKRGANWDEGPPLVGPDGMVESGNGRILALRLAAEINPEGYLAYRRQLLEAAPRFGLDRGQVAEMVRPVLVRERLTGLDERARRRFVAEANASGAARMGVAEQSRADAELIPAGFFADLDVADSDGSLADVLSKRKNGPVVTRFLDLLPETERATLMDDKGQLSAEGVRRLERAMFAYAMPGRAGERLARLLFEEAETIDRVGAGVRRGLPRLGQVEDLIRAGQRERAFSMGDDLAAAVEKMRDLRLQGLSVNDFLRQYRLPGVAGELTPIQEQLLVQLDARRRSGRAVADLITAYAQAVIDLPPPAQGRMFGAGFEVTREGLLRSAITSLGGTWVDLSDWSAAQRAVAGLGVPATQVQALTPGQAAGGMALARRVAAADVPQ